MVRGCSNRISRLVEREVCKNVRKGDVSWKSDIRPFSLLQSIRKIEGTSVPIVYITLAVSPQHACGRFEQKNSIHEFGAPYITPNFIIRRTAVLTIGVQCTFCAKAAPIAIS